MVGQHIQPFRRKVTRFQIPIPCPENPKKSLEIQAEIVRILDAFTELTAELTAELTTELTARKKQYNYYRDQLLSFEDGDVEWKTLGDVTKKWYAVNTNSWRSRILRADIPWVRTQEVKFSNIESTEVKITQAAVKNSAAKWIPANCELLRYRARQRAGLRSVKSVNNQPALRLFGNRQRQGVVSLCFSLASFNQANKAGTGWRTATI